MMKPLILTLVSILSGTAMAEPEPTTTPDAVDPTTATLLAVGGTVVSWGLVGAAVANAGNDTAAAALGTVGGLGTFIGPSLGGWYSHTYFTRGMKWRIAGLGVLGAAAAAIVSEGVCFDHCDESGALVLGII